MEIIKMNIYMITLKATSGSKEGLTEIYYGEAEITIEAIGKAVDCAKRDGYDNPEISQVVLCGKRAF
jgi:hypothetical protein